MSLAPQQGPPVSYRKVADLKEGENILPPLTKEEYASLKESISSEKAVLVPISIDENDVVIEGHHRLMLAKEVGLDEVPVRLHSMLDPAEKQKLALTLNLARRNLNQEQKRELIAGLIKADPEQSDRQIAVSVGVHNETVNSVRKTLVEAGDVTDSVTRTDSTGRKQPAKKQKEKPPAKASTTARATDPPDQVVVMVPRLDYPRFIDAAGARQHEPDGKKMKEQVSQWLLGLGMEASADAKKKKKNEGAA